MPRSKTETGTGTTAETADATPAPPSSPSPHHARSLRPLVLVCHAAVTLCFWAWLCTATFGYNAIRMYLVTHEVLCGDRGAGAGAGGGGGGGGLWGCPLPHPPAVLVLEFLLPWVLLVVWLIGALRDRRACYLAGSLPIALIGGFTWFLHAHRVGCAPVPLGGAVLPVVLYLQLTALLLWM